MNGLFFVIFFALKINCKPIMLAEQCDRCASDGHSNGSLLGDPPQAHDPQ